MAVNPSQVQLIAVLNISGKPPDNAIQVVMNTVVCVSFKSNKDAKRVELHKAVPIPAGNPGAAIVNNTIAGQATKRAVKVIGASKTTVMMKGA